MTKFSIALLMLSLLGGGCQRHKPQHLTIATAANMQFAMEDLVGAFREQTGIECETIISSSGKLTAQIVEGAPFDLLVSADLKYPQELARQGFAAAEPRVYAYGKLVLWSLVEGVEPSIDLLTSGRIGHIALANPKTAPYGEAAVEALRHYGLFERVEQKLVYGESIAQTNQFITTEAAEMGFTAKSVVLSPAIAGQGAWIEVDPATYTSIAQGVVVLNSRQDYLAQALKFQEFLFSERGREILDKFGYSTTLPESQE